MSELSFKDYVLISNAIVEAQLDEGAIWDAIKKKLGGSKQMSDDEIEAEIQRLKKLGPGSIEKIRATKASQDFHARKAADAKAGMRGADARRGTVSTNPTRSPGMKKLDSIATPNLTAGQARAVERDWAMREGKLTEAAEFEVTYRLRNGDDSPKRTRIKARDTTDVRRKFADTHYGAKIVLIRPAKPKVAKPVAEPEVVSKK